MKRWNLRSGILLSITGLAAVMQSAYAQQPPDPVASDASGNTASGSEALLHLDTTSGSGFNNSAFGYLALWGNTTGAANTAVGFNALISNTTGFGNVAVGVSTLYKNLIGGLNVAIGNFAITYNQTGNANTAVGDRALVFNAGDNNTASGSLAMYNNDTGANNAAFGYQALSSNTTGSHNVAQGVNALLNNTIGSANIGMGSNALFGNVSGRYNIALGYNAGYNQTTGNESIYIANPGVADESQTLRLGQQGTAGVLGSGIVSAYIAGVATTQVTGSAVYITPSGQLGVMASSERFKTDVETMGSASEKLAQLRPVTFRLKADPSGTKQNGLIAEEVAKVYPELVIHGADGRIDGVRYEELAPMLLNVFQQQQAQLAAQAKTADSDAQAIRNLETRVAQLNEFKQSMITALRETRPQILARAP